MWQCDTCVKHLPKFVMRIIYKSAVVNKKHWGLPAGFCQIKAPSTFINVSIVILLLFCKKKKKKWDHNNDNNYPTTAVLIHLLQHSPIVFELGSVIYSNVLKEVSSTQQGCIYLYSKKYSTCLIQEGGLKNIILHFTCNFTNLLILS